MSDASPPRVDDLTAPQRALAAFAMAAAAALWVWDAFLVVASLDGFAWWIPAALAAGIAAADFLSGLVHWTADTWGRDDFPIVGPRLLVPFRIHHVNPDDFVRRRFLDTNGEVAWITLPVLAATRLIPTETAWGAPLAVAGLALCGIGVMTNQIHQWAHMPAPPLPVRWLQRAGLFLRHEAHARHHDRPYDASYCITTGWCNAPLDAVGFFRHAERLITRLTGVLPRQDDKRYRVRLEA